MPALTDPEVQSRIAPNVVNCPVPTIALALKDTVVDFYNFTKVYKKTLDPIPTVALQPSYALTLPTGFQLIEPEVVRVNKLELGETSENQLDREWTEMSRGYTFSYRQDISFGGLDQPSWRISTATQPRYYYLDEEGKLRLVAIPDTVYTADLGIIAKVSLKPIARLLSAVDDVVWDDWYDTLVSGALHRLYRMPEKPWTDLKLAGVHGTQYDAGRNECQQLTARDNTRSDRGIYHSTCYA